jgi:hypothetical protein
MRYPTGSTTEDVMPFTHETDTKLAQHAFRLLSESAQPAANQEAMHLHTLRLVALLVRHKRLRLDDASTDELNRLLSAQHLDAFLIPTPRSPLHGTFFDGLDDGIVDASVVPPPVAATQAWLASMKLWNPFKK